MSRRLDPSKATALLDAAERVFYRDGDAALTVRRVVADADGTTIQTLYSHFGDRGALIDAMYGRALDGVASMVDGFTDPAVYAATMVAHPAWWVMFAHGRVPSGVDPELMAAERRRLLDVTHSVWRTPSPDVALMVLDGLVGSTLAGESARHDLRGRADLLAGLLTSSTARAARERVAS